MNLIFPALIIIFTFNISVANAHEHSESKKIVSAFFDLAFVQRKPTEAANKYISPNKYIQHNPEAVDGREAFIKGFAAYVEKTSYQCQIKQVIADSDIVAVHSLCKESAKDVGSAVVDIFRIEHNLIVEHWDVQQPIPVKSANKNTMF